MKSYLAKQSIIARNGTLIGNELLYRKNAYVNAYPKNISHEVATCTVITHHLQEVQQYCDNDTVTTAFINFDYQSLVNLTPLLFPKESIVIEILEDIKVDEKLLHALRIIKEKGYTLALDDVQLNSTTLTLLEFISIVKVDISQISIANAALMIERLSKRFPLRFLAERVETIEQYEESLIAGFDYFQGYFLGRPEINAIDIVQPSRLVELTDTMTNHDIRHLSTVLASEDLGACSTLMNIPTSSNNCCSIADVVSGLSIQQLKAFMYVSSHTSENTHNLNLDKSNQKIRGGTEDLLGVLIAITSILGDVDYEHVNTVVNDIVTLNCQKMENVTH